MEELVVSVEGEKLYCSRCGREFDPNAENCICEDMDGREALENLDRVAAALSEYQSDHGEALCVEAREHKWDRMRELFDDAVRCHSALVTALEHVNGGTEKLTLSELLTWLCEPQDDGSSPIGTSRLIHFVQSAHAAKSPDMDMDLLDDDDCRDEHGNYCIVTEETWDVKATYSVNATSLSDAINSVRQGDAEYLDYDVNGFTIDRMKVGSD